MVELPVGVQVAKIFASQNSSYFITENGEVYSWGQNDVGQLGLSSLVDVDHPKIIESFRNKPVGELVIRGNQIISIPEVPEDSLSEMNSSQELPSVDLDMIKQQELEDAIQVKGQARAPKATLKLDQNDVMSVAASRTSKKSNRSMKSMKSQRTSRSRGTSRRGGGGDDPFSGNLKGVLVKLNDVHALLKEIDGIAEDVLEGSDKKNKKNAG